MVNNYGGSLLNSRAAQIRVIGIDFQRKTIGDMCFSRATCAGNTAVTITAKTERIVALFGTRLAELIYDTWGWVTDAL